MSDKFDIRLRRKQFTEGRIQRYKNYDSLMERHKSSGKKRARGIAIMVFLLIVAIVITFWLLSKPKLFSYSKYLPDREIQGAVLQPLIKG